MRFDNQICIYCNKKYSTRRGDHIPPQSFFSKHRRYDLIQVPCCQECNNEYSAQDPQVRNFIAILETNESHPVVKSEIQGKVSRDWSKEGRRKQFIAKYIDLNAIVKYAKDRPLKHPSEMSDEDLNNFPMPLLITDEIHKFFGRMVRALTFNDLDSRVHVWSHRTRFIEQLDEADLQSVTFMKETMKVRMIGDDTFRWITFWNKPNGTVLCWMQFYGGTEIIVILASKELIG